MPSYKPHPLNVPGDFYVEDGCCISCLVPFEAAPDMLKYDDEASHCFVARQPSSFEEAKKMAEAMFLSEVDCIRYRGSDKAILQCIGKLGGRTLCDTNSPVLSATFPPIRPIKWKFWKK
jgi:hypothetical protein